MLDSATIVAAIQQTADFAQAQVAVQSDDQVHFNARIVAACFRDKSLLARQRMVYKALGDLMQQIHALQLTTLTPEQAAE